jgi:hypothetical protein
VVWGIWEVFWELFSVLPLYGKVLLGSIVLNKITFGGVVVRSPLVTIHDLLFLTILGRAIWIRRRREDQEWGGSNPAEGIVSSF